MPPVAGTVPLESYVRALEARSLGACLLSSLRYMFTTEVHVYAFSIAANLLLSFIPFVVLLLTFSKSVLHSQAAVDAIVVLLRDALPSNQAFIVGRLQGLAASHKAQALSLGMLLFTSTGVMLPLEVALNRIWGIPRNRSFLHNQAVSLGLAFCCGVLALASVLVTAMHLSAVTASIGRLGLTRTATALSWVMIKTVALPTIILIFFLLYYVMPNGKVPVGPVALAAVFAGVVTEIAKHVFIWLLPWLNFPRVYGPFYVSVTLLMWAFVAALVMLVGAHFSAQVGGARHGAHTQERSGAPGPPAEAPAP